MKRWVILAGILVFLAWGTGAWATLITFDSPPDIVTPPAANAFVDTQYSSMGVDFLYGAALTGASYYSLLNFTGTSFTSATPLYGGTLGTPSTDSPTWWQDFDGTFKGYQGSSTPTSNFLGFNWVSSPSALRSGTAMQFSSFVSSLSIGIDRPGAASGTTNVEIDLYNTLTGSLVEKATKTVTSGGGWVTFTSSAEDSPFNLALVYGTDGSTGKRFMVDNISYDPVPIPPSLFLLGGGLGGLGLIRRRKVKKQA